MKIKKIIALCMAFAVTATAAGCRSKEKETQAEAVREDGQITLTFWSWVPTKDQSEDLIERFEKENPDIRIDYVRTEQDDFFEKLQVAMASDSGPDLYGMTTGSMMEQYAKFSADMKEIADTYWSGWEKEIDENAVSQCVTIDGKMAGMPLLVAGMTTMMYNRTLMEECGIDKVPAAYEELKEASAKARAHGYICVAAGAADEWVNSDWFVQTSNEFEKGAVYEAERGDRKWTDPCFVETMKAWRRLFTDGIFEDGALGIATYPDARDQYFFARKAVFFMTGSWHLGPVSPGAPELAGTEIGNRKDVIGMEPFPSMADGAESVGTSGVDILIGMNQNCREKGAAMRFIRYLAVGEGQQYWVNDLQGAPVARQISYTGDIDGELQQQSIEHINAYISNAAGNRKITDSKIETAIQMAMQNVAAGADPVEELERVQEVAGVRE